MSATSLKTDPTTLDTLKRPRGHTGAVRLFLVGLTCFGLWFVVDANQLYNNALSAPLGTRRTVSIDLLGPVVRAEHFVHLGAVVETADRILGRNAQLSTPSPVGPPVFDAAPFNSVPVPLHQDAANTDFLQSALHAKPLNAPLPVLANDLVPLYPPSAQHPLTVLSVGDSLGVDLGIGLGDAVGSNPYVHVIEVAKVNTGLADLSYYNWSNAIVDDLATYHPQVVVMLLGANDWQPFKASNGRQAFPGTPLWRQRYGARVATIMREVRASGAHLVWVGLPILGPQNPFSPSMGPTLNAVFRSEVRRHPGVEFFSTYRLFMDSTHQFSEYLVDGSGSLVMMRSSDGVHFTDPDGDDQLGSDLVQFIRARLQVALAP